MISDSILLDMGISPADLLDRAAEINARVERDGNRVIITLRIPDDLVDLVTDYTALTINIEPFAN